MHVSSNLSELFHFLFLPLSHNQWRVRRQTQIRLTPQMVSAQWIVSDVVCCPSIFMYTHLSMMCIIIVCSMHIHMPICMPMCIYLYMYAHNYAPCMCIHGMYVVYNCVCVFTVGFAVICIFLLDKERESVSPPGLSPGAVAGIVCGAVASVVGKS